MKIAVITANIGEFDPKEDPVKQSVDFDFYRFTDEKFPPRFCAMTTRLQARIVKMFGWQMAPGYDFYIWADSSVQLSNPDSVKWFVEQCKDYDLAVFKHPQRSTIHQEAEYLKMRLAKNCPYITPRYKNELIDEQLAEIEADKGFEDVNLFASTVVVYKDNMVVRDMMKEWWYHTSRYHSIDQLSLPYAVYKCGCNVNILPYNYQKMPYLTYVRPHGKS
jgi:hypothetical protein